MKVSPINVYAKRHLTQMQSSLLCVNRCTHNILLRCCCCLLCCCCCVQCAVHGKKTQPVGEHMVFWGGEWTPETCDAFFLDSQLDMQIRPLSISGVVQADPSLCSNPVQKISRYYKPGDVYY
ncbi:hypothetical protein ABMA28_010972 [Loxostege sticticalis]|uniref:Uncharacterized protein n=1 Tax=Loxostege sticticalis TaxID=481309 RepID=A0ABD0S7Y9_LOXSC